MCVWLSITWHIECTNSEIFGLRNFSLNTSYFLLSPPSSFPLLWCAMSSWLGKCLASTNSLMMTLTLTHCVLDSLPQNPNKLINSKPICGTMQWEDPGLLMMDGLQPLVLWHQSFATHVCFTLLLNLHVAHCVFRALSGHKSWPWPHATLITLQQVSLVRPQFSGDRETIVTINIIIQTHIFSPLFPLLFTCFQRFCQGTFSCFDHFWKWKLLFKQYGLGFLKQFLLSHFCLFLCFQKLWKWFCVIHQIHWIWRFSFSGDESQGFWVLLLNFWSRVLNNTLLGSVGSC